MEFKKDIKFLKKKNFLIYKIENFLDEEFYNKIKVHFPKIDSNQIDLKDNFGKVSFKFNEIDFENDDQKATLENLDKIIMSKDFFKFFVRNFYLKNAFMQNNILRKAKYLRYPIRDFNYNSLINYFFSRISVSYKYSLIKNNGGIVPHVDAQRKYLSLMLYFPDDEKKELEYGTTFWSCLTKNHGNTHISEPEKIKSFKELNDIEFKTPFNKNCLYGFSRNDLSWHTVEPVNISDNYIRKSININFYYNN